jgi:cell division GTPase FtsZ
MIIAGPPAELNMEGFSHAKNWLENAIETPEVRGGDCPIRGWDSVAGVVMLSGYDEIPRLGVKLTKCMAGVGQQVAQTEYSAGGIKKVSKKEEQEETPAW